MACAVPSRMNPTLTALAGFVAWSLFLLVLMEGIRSQLVLTKAIAANGFTPNNSNLSPFMQRLARAHANCVEGLPIFGGLMLVAVLAGKASITDPLGIRLSMRAHPAVGHSSQLAVHAGGNTSVLGIHRPNGHRRVLGLSSAPRVGHTAKPNPSIERTCQRPLRALWPAAHVER